MPKHARRGTWPREVVKGEEDVQEEPQRLPTDCKRAREPPLPSNPGDDAWWCDLFACVGEAGEVAAAPLSPRSETRASYRRPSRSGSSAAHALTPGPLVPSCTAYNTGCCEPGGGGRRRKEGRGWQRGGGGGASRTRTSKEAHVDARRVRVSPHTGEEDTARHAHCGATHAHCAMRPVIPYGLWRYLDGWPWLHVAEKRQSQCTPSCVAVGVYRFV